MTRRTTIPVAALLVAVAAGLVVSDRVQAIEPRNTEMRVTGSDATARFVPLGINKAVVIDLTADIRDVLVADPKTVNAVVRTNRRVYIMGTAAGQTNVYFFDAAGRQIGALDIAVTSGSPPIGPENFGPPAKEITVYRGATGTPAFYSCTFALCLGADKPDTTTYTDTTIHNLSH